MPCSCNHSSCSECMGGYIPLPDPEKGSPRWKDDVAYRLVNEKYGRNWPRKSCIIHIGEYEGHYIGYFSIQVRNGIDYFRTENIECFTCQN